MFVVGYKVDQRVKLADSCCCLMQLDNGMGGAEHYFYVPDRCKPAVEDLPEASGRLDMPAHRLDCLLAQPASGLPPGAPDRGGVSPRPRKFRQSEPRRVCRRLHS